MINPLLGILVFVTAVSGADTPAPWLLPNFADRLELVVTNPSDTAVETLAVVPVAEAARTSLGFPGTLSIVIDPSGTRSVLPSQSDDLDGDGIPDEFVFPVKLAAHEERVLHIYYSMTLREPIPWPKRVHANHSFGYNRSTIALESEVIGYRTYGGFFLDIQARLKDRPGLNNTLVGFLGSGNAEPAGMDIIHLGDTLGLGGLFLRSGTDLFQPPLNMPDYAHKPAPIEAPVYRVIADGPIRAIVEARMDSWTIGQDAVRIVARYSIAGGRSDVECRFDISPIQVSRTYEVGAGIRHLPRMEASHAQGRLSLSGEQNQKTGKLAMALYYDPATAAQVSAVKTKDDANEAVVFNDRLTAGHAIQGRYRVAAAWSGSGITNLLQHLATVEHEARATVTTGRYQHTHTPRPDRVEGESD